MKKDQKIRILCRLRVFCFMCMRCIFLASCGVRKHKGLCCAKKNKKTSTCEWDSSRERLQWSWVWEKSVSDSSNMLEKSMKRSCASWDFLLLWWGSIFKTEKYQLSCFLTGFSHRLTLVLWDYMPLGAFSRAICKSLKCKKSLLNWSSDANACWLCGRVECKGKHEKLRLKLHTENEFFQLSTRVQRKKERGSLSKEEKHNFFTRFSFWIFAKPNIDTVMYWVRRAAQVCVDDSRDLEGESHHLCWIFTLWLMLAVSQEERIKKSASYSSAHTKVIQESLDLT